MDQTIPQERAATNRQSFDTAVVVAAVGVFGRAVENADGVGPLTIVGGLPLFVRTVLTLQRAGIRDIVVLAGVEEANLKQLVRDDPRVTASVRWRPVREFPPDDHRTWEALAQEVSGSCLIVGAQMVLTRQLVEALGREVEREPAAFAVLCDGQATTCG